MRRSWFALAAVLFAATATTTAHAEESPAADVAQAESYANQAFDAYSQKKYEDAVVLYMKALDAAPSSDILYNLARIYDTKLKDRDLAMQFYRRYIADPGADPDRVRQANARLSQLRELELAATDKPAAESSATEPSEAARSSSQPLSLPPPEEERGWSGTRVAGLVTGLVGIGGLAAGTVFGLAAKSDADTANDDCEGNDCRTQRGVDAAEDASKKATISTVSFVAGGALTALGTVLFFAGGRDERPERDTARLRLTPYAGPDSVGTHLSGRW